MPHGVEEPEPERPDEFRSAARTGMTIAAVGVGIALVLYAVAPLLPTEHPDHSVAPGTTGPPARNDSAGSQGPVGSPSPPGASGTNASSDAPDRGAT